MALFRPFYKARRTQFRYHYLHLAFGGNNLRNDSFPQKSGNKKVVESIWKNSNDVAMGMMIGIRSNKSL